MQPLLEEQHKYGELRVTWHPAYGIFVWVGSCHCYDEDRIMFWLFVAEQFLKGLCAAREGDILSFTEGLNGLS